MSANFLPDGITGITPERQFRFWCQKVLPLVYDDSLSYYELLNKVVNYLNHVIEDVNTLGGDISTLSTAYENLQNYVNTYFANLDIYGEVSAKVDEMAEDGSLLAVLEPVTEELTQYLREQSAAQDAYNAQTRTIVQNMVGHPYVATTPAEMTDTSKIYVYSGPTQAGFTNGHWYYYNGQNWADGGIYNAVAVSTDKTLTREDEAADAMAAGTRITDLTTTLSWTQGQKINTLTGAQEGASGYAISEPFPATSMYDIVGWENRFPLLIDADSNIELNVVHFWDGNGVYLGFCLGDRDFGYAMPTSTPSTANFHPLANMPQATVARIQVLPNGTNWTTLQESRNYIAILKRHYVGTDKTLLGAGVPADAEATGTEITATKAMFPTLGDDFLTVEYKVINNKGFNPSTGAIPDENGWDITDYIPVTGGETLFIYNGQRSTGYNGFWTAEMEYIGSFTLPINDNNVVVVPSNAAYMLISNRHAEFDFIVKRRAPGLAEKRAEWQAASELEELNGHYYNVDLANGSIVTPGNINPNAINTATYIPVKYGQYVLCDVAKPVKNSGDYYVYGYDLYDSNKTSIIHEDYGSLTQNKNSLIIENQNAAFIRFTVCEYNPNSDGYTPIRITDFPNNEIKIFIRYDKTVAQQINELLDGINVLRARIDSIVDDIPTIQPVIYDGNTIITETSVTNGSVMNPANTNAVRTDLIPVIWGEKITIDVKRTLPAGHFYTFGSIFLDADENTISPTFHDYSTQSRENTRITNLTSEYYVRFSICESDGSRYYPLRETDFAAGDVEVRHDYTTPVYNNVHSYLPILSTEVGTAYYLDGTEPEIKVISYNVSQYKCDTSAYINNTKILSKLRNFVDFLGTEFPDFMGTQEDTEYLDGSAQTMKSAEYIFQPVFQEWYKGGNNNENVCYAHKNHVPGEGGLLDFRNAHSWSRTIKWDIFTIGTKRILICSMHAGWTFNNEAYNSEASINERYTEYQDVMRWAKGEITMNNKFSPYNAITCPTHDYTIIMLDANTGTETDKANILNLASENGFKCCNGGRFGWLNTCIDGSGIWALDNIIVSDNILIKNVTAKWEWYNKLYSDHVPLVAELVLT